MTKPLSFNPSYIGVRNDILELIPKNAKHVLDVGCSNGALGEQVRRKWDAEICGIELDPGMAAVAASKLDRVITADIESLDLALVFGEARFDCIIFADILEHLKDPWKVLKDLHQFLKPEGIIIASIPNVRHFTTCFALVLGGRWPYRDRGIHDRTHLRFFTIKNIGELFDNAELRIVKVQSNLRIIERPHRLNYLAKIFNFLPVKDFFVFQYLVVSRI